MLPEVCAAAADLGRRLRAEGSHLQDYEVERAMIDAQGVAERRFEMTAGDEFRAELVSLRERLGAGVPLAETEATARYGLINAIVAAVEQRDVPRVSFGDPSGGTRCAPAGAKSAGQLLLRLPRC